MKENGKNILVLSNGYGEDTIAASILREIFKLRPGIGVMVFPLVGAGAPYNGLPVKLCGPREIMPSEGMVPESLTNFFGDIRGGLASLTIKQLRELGRLKNEAGLCVAVGDIIPVIFSIIGTGKRPVFIGTAKSDYFVPYSSFERFILKRWSLLSMVRDPVTAEALVKDGINAVWLGNAMMDALEFTGENFKPPEGTLNIALLPGSRGSVVTNFVFMLKVLDRFRQKYPRPVQGLVALAPSSNEADLIEAAAASGWEEADMEKNGRRLGKIKKENHNILFLRGCFGDLLLSSDLALGQGGTANEQAAGLQKPVIAFEPGGEKSLKWYRKRQKGLLGDALLVVDRDEKIVADELLSLISSPERQKKMAAIGKERLGPAGGSLKMAKAILENYDLQAQQV